VQKEAAGAAVQILGVRIFVQVVDPLGVEQGAAPLDAVHLVSLGQEKLGEIRAVLPGDAGD
jgi:hypothetical protein